MGAVLPQAALPLAQHSTVVDPTPEPVDAAVLRRHQRACQFKADNLTYKLSLLPEQVAWARRRLAALPTLRTALVPTGTSIPPWLELFQSEARNELATKSSTAQALLKLRQAALAYEAEQTRLLLAAPE
jgi:hypothetical protein